MARRSASDWFSTESAHWPKPRRSLTPSSAVFGFKLDTEWSDPTLNDQTTDQSNGCPGPCGHHVRVWPAKNRQGAIIPNTYILGMDYQSINYDFQDTVYLVSNIAPAGSGEPTPTPPPGGFPVKINFQPNSAPVPSGYTKDTGLAYDTTRGFGWVLQSDKTTPIDISANTRDRNQNGIDQRLDTFIHMQYTGGSGVTTPAAWQFNVPNGTYSVTVSVGDTFAFDSSHKINVEGSTVAINGFVPTSALPFEIGTVTVVVSDGKLTIDAVGGANTKLDYLEIVAIAPGTHPQVTGGAPADNATNTRRDIAVNSDVSLPNLGQGVDQSTLTTANTWLYETQTNTLVPGTINTTGGGDAIVYQPAAMLAPNTNYTFRVSERVTDESGASFLPYSTTFTTGTEPAVLNPPATFDKQTVYSADAAISTVMIGPDHKLYAAFLDGRLKRWTIAADGSLSGEQTFTGLDGRAIIGMAFDPTNANVLWVSHNAPLYPEPAPDWTGKISKLLLSGSAFTPTVQDYIVGLPRSAKDHLSNSIAFGPDGMLYLNQGSMSAMGAPDNAWYGRAEHALSGAVLKINPNLGSFPINVQTEGLPTNYNPSAPGAPVTVFGAGTRNAYDLVWHTNGHLYVPANGSAAGGNTPASPNGAVPALNGAATQDDFLFVVDQGGYYGHPNPLLNHYVLNGGNPTSGVDPAEVVDVSSGGQLIYDGYPVGVNPDPAYAYYAWDFGRNRSPNGVNEYKSATFGGVLQGKLLVVEYSGGDDILVLTPGGDGNITKAEVLGVPEGFANPLDLVEDPTNGNIYIVELVSFSSSGALGAISILKPA